MLRSRLKNIINKSKEVSNQKVGDSYDLFVKSLPSELDYYKDGGKYRLKAAWKAYGLPKNYQEALWQGLVETIGGTFKMPSIGYNEEDDSYEYLNTGKDNDIIAKDIRVWDNDVIPLVKELKLGGYVRTFDEEKDCWKYSKNPQKEVEYFKDGGKTRKKDDKSYNEFLKTLPKNLLGGLDDYRMRVLFDNTPDVWTFDDGVKSKIFQLNNDGLYHAPSIVKMPDGNYEFLKSANHPTVWMEEAFYNGLSPKLIDGREDNGNIDNYELVDLEGDDARESINHRMNYTLEKYDKEGNPLQYWKYVKRTAPLFKTGGQLNLIPDGSLHARKNNMELAKDGMVTHKGVPVVDMLGVQQAEIERDELILNFKTTEKVEDYYKKYEETESQSEKDKIAIACGKMLAKSIIEDTDDKTGLIEKEASKL